LNVSRSGYYEWLTRLDSPRAQENALLLKHIEEAVRDRETGARRARVLKRWASRQVARAKQQVKNR